MGFFNFTLYFKFDLLAVFRLVDRYSECRACIDSLEVPRRWQLLPQIGDLFIQP
jgi:hypothetical protein